MRNGCFRGKTGLARAAKFTPNRALVCSYFLVAFPGVSSATSTRVADPGDGQSTGEAFQHENRFGDRGVFLAEVGQHLRDVHRSTTARTEKSSHKMMHCHYAPIHHRHDRTGHESDGLEGFLLDVEVAVEPREAEVETVCRIEQETRSCV